MITKDQWVDWKQHPVTIEFLKAIYRTREGLKEGIAEGQAESDKEMYLAVGRTQGIKDCFEYATKTFEYIELEEPDSGT